MAGGNYRSRANNKRWIDRINYFRIGDRVDFVEPYYVRVPADPHFVAAANNIQVTDAHVITHPQTRDADDDIKVSYGRIRIDFAPARVDYAEANMDATANLVTKE